LLTSVYVDAFNLYYGALKGTPYRWLDLGQLCALLLPDAEIARIRYFTAIVRVQGDDVQAPQRQQVYLRALSTIDTLSIHYGSFMRKRKTRPLTDGGGYVEVHDTEEKGSDVNLASYLLHDGHRGQYEQAVVVSNDSDLRHPIELVRDDLKLRVGLLNPHKNVAHGLRDVANFYKPIRAGVLGASQFPATLTDVNGTFTRPPSWK
jgi:hypothetical protein